MEPQHSSAELVVYLEHGYDQCLPTREHFPLLWTWVYKEGGTGFLLTCASYFPQLNTESPQPPVLYSKQREQVGTICFQNGLFCREKQATVLPEIFVMQNYPSPS